MLVLCTLAGFASGCSSNVIDFSDGRHFVHAVVLSDQPHAASTKPAFLTWVLFDRGEFLHCDGKQVGVADLGTAEPTHNVALIPSARPLHIFSDSLDMGRWLVSGALADVGVRIILDANHYLAKAEGDAGRPAAVTQPIEGHFVAFITGIGVIEGRLYDNGAKQ